MANGDSPEPVTVVLSRDELLLILSLVQAQFIPGVDVDPLGELTPEQQDLAFVVAARGLRARDLARVRPEDGRLAVHVGLLAAVSACAYASDAVFAYHWPSNADVPARLFGHVRDGSFVVHAPVEDVLHRFTMLPSKESLVDRVVAACHPLDAPVALSGEIRLAGDDFARLRQLAEQGDGDQARSVLPQDPGLAELASALVTTLSSQPQVSILQTLRQVDAGSVLKRDFTLVQDSGTLWLVAPTSADANILFVKATAPAEVRTLLLESI